MGFFIRNLRALHLLFAGTWGREFIFCRYCPPIVFYPQIWMTKMNSKIEGNTLGILRWSFFPFNALGMPSFNNSVTLCYFCTCDNMTDWLLWILLGTLVTFIPKTKFNKNRSKSWIWKVHIILKTCYNLIY